MKDQTNKIAAIIILLLLGFFISIIFNLFNTPKIDRDSLDLADTRIEDLESVVFVLEQRQVLDSIAIDSLTQVIKKSKSEVELERSKQAHLLLEHKETLARFDGLSDNDQVKEFISATGENYNVMTYDGYYLISFESIQFASRNFINYKFKIKQVESLELEIKSFNELILEYDKRFELVTSSYLSDRNKILANKDRIIMNLNIKIDIYEKSFGKVRVNKKIVLGVGIAVIGILLVK